MRKLVSVLVCIIVMISLTACEGMSISNKRYEELTKMIADPEVISNQAEWQKAIKEHASIEDVVVKEGETLPVDGIILNGKIDQTKINEIANYSINTVMEWDNDTQNIDNN